MANSIDISGLKDIQKALRELPLKLQGKVTQAALAKGARLVVKRAKTLAPFRTGVLRNSIYSRASRDSTTAVMVREVTVKSGKRARRRNRDAFYWRFVEFGYRTGAKKGEYLEKIGRRFRGKGNAVKSTGSVPARPFMRPAFEAEKRNAARVITDELRRQVAKAAKEVRRAR